MNRKYIVRLDAKERDRLEQIVRVGKAAAYRIRHANILLAVDESPAGARMKDADAARAFHVSGRSIELLRKRLVEEGLDAALDRRKQVRPSIEKMFDGEKEAKLIALACGPKLFRQTRNPCEYERYDFYILQDFACFSRV